MRTLLRKCFFVLFAMLLIVFSGCRKNEQIANIVLPIEVQETNRGTASSDNLFNAGIAYLTDANKYDFAKAMDCLQKAADEGHPRAFTWLGLIYANGYGVEYDLEKAAYYYAEGAKRGDPIAFSHLSGILFGQCDYDQWRQLRKTAYELAVKNNDHKTLYHCYAFGVGCERDARQMFIHALSVAETGDHEALNLVGQCYSTGYGVERNLSKALKYWEMAAEKGYLPAMFKVAASYEIGLVGLPSENRADNWYGKVFEGYRYQAEHSVPNGKRMMSYFYTGGYGKVPKSAQMAETYAFNEKKWQEDFAKKGFISPMISIHAEYLKGELFKEADKYYKTASKRLSDYVENGCGTAEMFLGELKFAKGFYEKPSFIESKIQLFYKGTKFNHKQRLIDEADALFQKAADNDAPFIESIMAYRANTEEERTKWCFKGACRGVQECAYQYATLLNEGKGVPMDKKEALTWAKLAFIEAVKPNARNQALELIRKLNDDLLRKKGEFPAK